MATLTDLLTSKIPPHEIDAERGILGAVLWGHPGALEKAQRRLEPDDFYTEGHRLVWEALERLAAQGHGIDIVTLGAELRGQGDYDQAGGGLAALMAETATAIFVDDYIRLIRLASGKRRAIRVATEAIGEAYEGGAADALERAAASLHAAAERATIPEDTPDAQRRPQRLGEVLDAVVASLDHEETDLCPTPIPDLNDRLGGGMLRGELCYLGGRPGTSKTALALQWALLAAQRHCPALVVSREMKNLALGQRVLAQQAQVSATAIRKHDLDLGERTRIARALPRLRGLPVWFDDEASSIAQIRRAVHTLRPRLLVVDYVQLIRTPDGRKDRRLEITAVSAGLKDLTTRYGCSVLALSSLRRLGPPEKGQKGQPKRRPDPTLDDLKESGDLEADADIVILLHQPNPDSTDRRLLYEKVRSGQGGGGTTLDFKPIWVRFTQVADGADLGPALNPDDPASERDEVPF